MPRLILIRHGQSLGNANRDIIQGSGPDPANVLDDLGERQAYACGKTLNEQGIVFSQVWSSPLIRAKQTAQIALQAMGCALPIQEHAMLREMCKGLAELPGGMEGRQRKDVETAEYKRQCQDWKFRHGSPESGGETAEEVGIRGLVAMRVIAGNARPEETIGIFTHGQLIRYTIGAGLGWPDIRLINEKYMLRNCAGVAIDHNPRDLSWQITGRINTPTVT